MQSLVVCLEHAVSDSFSRKSVLADELHVNPDA